MREKDWLVKILEEATNRVSRWPKWKRDAADQWAAQLDKDTKISDNNLKGWGPFDQ